jgi:hypothetical protein
MDLLPDWVWDVVGSQGGGIAALVKCSFYLLRSDRGGVEKRVVRGSHKLG